VPATGAISLRRNDTLVVPTGEPPTSTSSARSSPRQRESLAAETGVSQPTFSSHLRDAQRRVLSLLFADGEL